MENLSVSIINVVIGFIIILGSIIVGIINIKRISKNKTIKNNIGGVIGIRKPSMIRISLMLFFLFLLILFASMVIIVYAINIFAFFKL